MPKPRSSLLRWLPAILVLLLMGFLASRFVEWSRFPELLERARPAWLLAALGLQGLKYFVAAGALQRSMTAAGFPVPVPPLVPVILAKLFTDQVTPASGVGGTLVAGRALRNRGLSRGDATAALVVNTLAYYAASATAALVAVAILWERRGFHPAITVVVSLFAIYAVGMPTLILWAYHHPPRRLPRWLSKVPGVEEALKWFREAPNEPLRHRLLLGEAALFQLAVIALDAMTLMLLVGSLGQAMNYPAAFSAFVLGTMAGTVTLLPAGIGTFEAGTVGTLRYLGTPLEAAIAAVILFRGFTLYLPLLPGSWIARNTMNEEGDRAPAPERVPPR
ncbi:MAG TPA: lysylphosphatidylglycerol synthase transmembrane domain-containing protein [Candidatus Eisenbacteria bacterium]|nr:lysylphosphatidylglycerol synthase transmembrane domain-containing protein [Candidatus Eisenbacteria bacterium]